jgi:CheY-like chemotaxis protein
MQKPHRILIVDDDPMVLRFLSEVMEGPFQLMTANSGEAALACIGEFKPDIVLLDVMMPGIDGYETCRRIRSNPGMVGIRILFLSAKAGLEERLKGYQIGGDDYISKPFAMEELKAKISVFSKLKDRRESEAPAGRVFDPKHLELIFLIQERLAHIVLIRAQSPYCHVIGDARKLKLDRIRIPIQVLDDYFNGRRLLRVHRSYLINPNRVIALNRYKNNECKLLLDKGKAPFISIPVGRSYQKRLQRELPALFAM